MLRHRMWLVLALYVVILAVIAAVLEIAGAPGFIHGLVVFLIASLVGLEAGTLRRFTLRRRGWTNVGVVTGEDREDAERRFFDAWLRRGANPAAPAAVVPPPPAVSPHSYGIIGLFPEPGASR
jgi:hypothetical protein